LPKPPEQYAVVARMPPLSRGQYLVRYVRPASDAPLEQTPPEIRERFEGRSFALHELEQRGVRIAGGQAWYTTNGQDWRLILTPELGTND
jgi:hypothetical protein